MRMKQTLCLWAGILLQLQQIIFTVGFFVSTPSPLPVEFVAQQQRQRRQQRQHSPIEVTKMSSTALYSNCIDRKNMLKATLALVTMSEISLMNPMQASAGAPQAPIETLFPAVRVKLSIDAAIVLAKELIRSTDPVSSSAIIEQLKNILLKPQDYTKTLKLQGVPEKPADLYTDAYKPMKGDLPFQRYLIKSGDISTWKDLKKKEKQQERDNEIRAALNAYTDALMFSGSSYLLNVDRATKSSMVREDVLPDVKQVITSDMGMRYLYRNQVLTAMDDVRAELEYVLAQHLDGSIDISELLSLLVLAQQACDRWFELIDPMEVKKAFQIVEGSEEGQQ